MAHVKGSVDATSESATFHPGSPASKSDQPVAGPETLDEINKLIAGLAPGDSMIVLNLRDELYHQCQGWSRSQLALLVRKTPLHFWDKYINPDKPEDSEETEAMIMGKIFHSLVLEPEKDISGDIYVYEKFARRSKEQKAEWAAMVAEAGERMMITQEAYDDVVKMAEGARKTPIINAVFSGGDSEVSVFWRDPTTGLVFKIRADYVQWDMKLVGDLKSTKDADPDEFASSCWKFQYHMQHAMYLHVMKQALGDDWTTFVFVAMEKQRPYAAGFYRLCDDDVALGMGWFLRAKSLLKECLDSYQSRPWPGYPLDLTTIELAPWARKKDLFKTSGGNYD